MLQFLGPVFDEKVICQKAQQIARQAKLGEGLVLLSFKNTKERHYLNERTGAWRHGGGFMGTHTQGQPFPDYF